MTLARAMAFSICALFCAACSSNVGSINITVVTAPTGMQSCNSAGVCTSTDAGPDSGAVPIDPFADVSHVRVEVSGPDLIMKVVRPIKERGAALDEVPVGPDRQVTVEGLLQDEVVLRGRTAPFEVKEGTINLILYVGRVDRFSYINSKNLKTPRAFHTATLLPDNRVLLTGGVTDGVTGTVTWNPLVLAPLPPATATAELIEANALQTSATAGMAVGRAGHTAALTAKNFVLMAGGAAPADAGPPPDVSITDAFVPPDSAIVDSAVDVMPDGPADAADAAADGPDPDGPTADSAAPDVAPPDLTAPDSSLPAGAVPLLELVELYDRINNKFSKSSVQLKVPRFWHRGASTESGVLVVGGASEDSPALRSVELYTNDGRLTFFNMGQARRAAALVVLEDGTVMVSGGLDSSGQPLRSIELWTPGAPNWSPGPPMSQPRAFHTATRLESGKVLLIGGLSSVNASRSIERYDPKTKTVKVMDTIGRFARWAHTATLLDDSRVLVAGGFLESRNGSPNTGTLLVTVSEKVFDHVQGQPMNEARAGHTATKLRSGAVLITGGLRGGGVPPSDTAEVYIY